MIEELWQILKSSGGDVQRRVDEFHPLDLYADYQLPDRPGLVLVSPVKPGECPRTRSISLSAAKRDDGTWILRMSLEVPALEPVFAELCKDIIETTREGVEKKAGVQEFIKRVERWRRLLEQGSASFGTEASRGLIGELVFLRSYALTHLSAADAVNAWIGPIGAPQDFLFPSGRRFEIKALAGSAENVRINGLEQLDGGGDPISLVAVRMDRTGHASPGAVTISMLSTLIRENLAEDPSVQEEFDRLLRLTGWEEDDEANPYSVHIFQLEHYVIASAFPRLTSDSVPAGVIDADYQIRLPAPDEVTTVA